MNSFKSSIKNAFKKKEKSLKNSNISNGNDNPSNAESLASSFVVKSNGSTTTHSIGHQSDASSVRSNTIVRYEGSPSAPLPSTPHPDNSNSSISIVDLAGYAQPQSTVADPNGYNTVPSSKGIHRVPYPAPSNPQLVGNTPLVRTQNGPIGSSTLDARSSETEPRGPQAIQEHQLHPRQQPSAPVPGPDMNIQMVATSGGNHSMMEGATVDDDTDDLTTLHRSGTLPPSYNSLNIPLPPSARNNTIYEASAPSPDLANISTSPNTAMMSFDNNSAAGVGISTPAHSPMSYVAPPNAPLLPNQTDSIGMYHSATMPSPVPTISSASPSNQSFHRLQHPYAISSASGPWSTASTTSLPQHQPYSPATSIAGAQNYGHRPYVIPGSENQTYPIIMAIDWGTTYSSMAYAFQQDGSKEIIEWGYPAKHAITKPPFKNHVLLSKYKLHLDESAGPHPPLPNGLTVVDAIADYLRLFHAHVIQTVLKGFGSSFDQQHIQYCLSVPAMWTDNAKAMMRQAALQAGMISPLDPPHRLLLISEPEAAALYCEKKCDQFSIGHGQRFMICDAGGGTVDLIVFEVAVGPQGRTLREVTRGSGHSCGSIFLDERMEALLRRRFAKWQEKGLTAGNWVQLMETFIHNVKPLFDGIEDQYITMPAVPGRAELTDYDIGLEDGVLTISAEEMRREVFDPVVNDVLRLIQHQLQQTQYQCNAIFLVGGFGCSSYLHSRVQAEFGSRVPMIGVPPRAELAVVRGAAYAGLMPRTITQRVARRWYGVDSLMAFEEGVDAAHKKVRDREGMIRARDRFSVYVSPGQPIGVDECITKRYITYQYPKPVNSPLFACSSMNLPRYVDSPLVEKIGDFLIPLPFVPGAQPGHKMVFELRMYFGATEIRAEAEVNGMVVSTRCQFSG
ncbi:Heat shock 70 kDa protein 12A [Lobosporangium transversale]|nr:Heat shock 70 kDa protein 12A [Lobosporangium transversale]